MKNKNSEYNVNSSLGAILEILADSTSFNSAKEDITMIVDELTKEEKVKVYDLYLKQIAEFNDDLLRGEEEGMKKIFAA